MKLKVSVGIPAYNEEANIGHLVSSLLQQKEDGFVLEEILVVSDGSTDNTVKRVRSIDDDRVKVIEHKERRGLPVSQNEIVNRFDKEILVLMDADVLPDNDKFLRGLVSPFRSKGKVGMVSCANKPLKPRTFFGRVMNFSLLIKNEMIERYKDGKNIYTCSGHVRAFSKEFAKKLRWPDGAVGEDAYSYLLCQKLGLGYIYQKEVAVLFSPPQSLRDHFGRSIRFMQSKRVQAKLFPGFSKSEYQLPLDLQFGVSLKYFLKNPVFFIVYFIVYMTSVVVSRFRKSTTVKWVPAASTKVLVSQDD